MNNDFKKAPFSAQVDLSSFPVLILMRQQKTKPVSRMLGRVHHIFRGWYAQTA